MRTRIVSIIVLAVSIIALVVCTAAPYAEMAQEFENDQYDGNFAEFYAEELFTYRGDTHIRVCGLVLRFAAVTALSALFVSIFTKTVEKNCTLKTSIITMILSAVVGTGLFSVLSYVSTYVMTNPSKHPIRNPVSLLLGCLCLAAFILLLVIYGTTRRGTCSAAGVTVDVLFSLLYVLPWFAVCLFLDEVFTPIIKTVLNI